MTDGCGYGASGYGTLGYGGCGDTPVTAPVLLSVAARADPQEWVVGVGPWRGDGPDRWLPAAAGRQITRSLLEPSTSSCTFTGPAGEEPPVQAMADDVWIYRGTVLLERHRVRDAKLIRGETAWNLTVAGVDYREWFNRLPVSGDRDLSGLDLADGVRDLLEAALALPGGALGVTFGAWPDTGYLLPADTVVRDGQGTWDAVASLIAGRADITIGGDLEAVLYTPGLEVDSGEALVHGVNVSSLEDDQGQWPYANVVRMSGAQGTASYRAELPGLSSMPQGRVEVVVTDPSLTSDALVQAAAVAELGRRSAAQPSYTAALSMGWWRGPEHVDVGDLVAVQSAVGVPVDDTARVVSLQIRVGSSGDEHVQVVAGRPRTSQIKIIQALIKKTTALGLQP